MLILSLLLACSSDPEDTEDKGDTLDSDPADTDSVSTEDPRGGLVVDGCADGDWTEALPDLDANLGELKRGYDTLGPQEFLLQALQLRYPTGAYILQGGLQNRSLGDCLQLFSSSRQQASADGMLDASSTVVHECGHFFDIAESGRVGSTYIFNEEVRLSCDGGSYVDTPPRSLILLDPYAGLRPPCPQRGEFGCDDYAQVYLDGDPDNGEFESGDQGLDTVVEESVQYINSLATDWAFSDRLRNNTVSARDGILTFLWYTERYLRHMRLEEPRAYARVLDDPCWREAILTVWGRSWLFLTATKDVRPLGIDDDDLMVLVTDPDLLAEIDALRDAEGCKP